MKKARIRALIPIFSCISSLSKHSRNEKSPYKGIDTFHTCLQRRHPGNVEMKKARIRALIHWTMLNVILPLHRRNEESPYKSIDTILLLLRHHFSQLCRNEESPLKGIDTL